MEQWKTLTGYDRPYMVSSEGRVSNGERMLSPCMLNSGYHMIALRQNGQPKPFLVHRLVAMMFIPNPDGRPCVNHKDEDKTNNAASNLEWCTYRYNINYGTCIERRAARRRRPVLQMALDGEVIRRWSCAPEAARELHMDKSSIVKAANGITRTAGGYRWRYDDVA